MSEEDILWKQRINHYQKALSQLKKAVELSQQWRLSDIEQQGIIQAFEFTHELAWNVMKDFFEYQGNTAIMGSRDATREAFLRNLIDDGDGWMEMIKSRNQSSHTYNPKIAAEIATNIISIYYQLFVTLEQKMQALGDRL